MRTIKQIQDRVKVELLGDSYVANTLHKSLYRCTPEELDAKRKQILAFRAERERYKTLTAKEKLAERIKRDPKKFNEIHRRAYTKWLNANEHKRKEYNESRKLREANSPELMERRRATRQKTKEKHGEKYKMKAKDSNAVIANRLHMRLAECPEELLTLKRAQILINRKVKEINEKHS